MAVVRFPTRLVFATMLAVAATGLPAQGARTIKLPPAESKLADEFSLILSVRELSDGRVLIADITESKVVVADFKVGTVAQVGRQGQGPGEYQIPGPLLAIGGDSTLMIERRSFRWHLFHRASLVATLPPDNAAVAAMSRQATGADGRGYAVRTVSLPAQEAGKAAAVPATLPESGWVLRAHRGTARVDTLARVKNVKSILNSTTNARGEITQISITRAPFAVGEEIVLFEDGWLAIARLDPYRVDWIAADGRVTKGRPLPWPATKITEGDVEAFLSVRARATASATAAQSAEALRRRVEAAMKILPDALPPVAVGGLTPMEDGRVLIRHPDTADFPNARYDVVDRHGALAGSIAMGKGETIVAISKTWAYVVTTDNDGLQFLSRHPWTARPFAP